ncbi:MAG: EAL domain-containing protein [Gammaproteobacteria bacterium]|nr:EAL domain-containing protein [Gammaproteobacteria bacterium]
MAKVFIKNWFLPFYHSLRGKFILASVLVSAVLIVSNIATQFYINQSSSEATFLLERRLEKLNQTRFIMDNVWDVSFFLEEHSIAPSNSTYSRVFNKMIMSVERLLKLIESESADEKIVEKLVVILSDFNQLGIYINQLMDVRANPAKLYPAIEISRSSMFESQKLFSHLVSESIDETIAALEPSETVVLEQLLDLRYKWVQVTSLYRMYLVNRLALLDSDALTSQVGTVNIYLKNINDGLVLLNRFKASGVLGFQTEESLPDMMKAVNDWTESFKKIVSTDTPEEWRSDYSIIKTKVAPLMKVIWENVRDYDENIEHDVKNSIIDLSGVASNTSLILWGLTITGMLVLVALFYFVHNTVLNPIKQISVAMRQEAQDGSFLKPLLIKGKSLETKSLIEAFSYMQLQVHSRKSDLEYQALHDDLTKLPNRLLLFDRLEQNISKAKRDQGSLTLIMMDLDRFKEINDTLGHHAGDELLQLVSNRLIHSLREVDTVARLGGDEFAILIPDCDRERSKIIAQKIQQSMQAALEINEQSLYIHGSLGIAIYPQHGTDVETLLKNADIAMYASKRNNSDYEIYVYEQELHSINKLELKFKLQKAIQNGELQLYYQPQLSCDDLRLVGAEALLRWVSNEDGNISPDVFIPLAEESGLIKSLTEWVIVEAMKQKQIWLQNLLEVPVSINLSAWNLSDPELHDYVLRCFEKYDLTAEDVSFEITESAMMNDTERALKIMQSFNKSGFDLIVDDYGTGFSSLAYLKKFPVKELKIDKSFVINMIENENDAVIVKSTIDLAHNLGLGVIAEGVETKEIFDLLKALDCDKAQGYFIARPMPADKFNVWFSSYRLNQLSEVIS